MSSPVETIALGVNDAGNDVEVEVRSRAIRILISSAGDLVSGRLVRYSHVVSATYDPPGPGNQPATVNFRMQNQDDYVLDGPAAEALWPLIADQVEDASP